MPALAEMPAPAAMPAPAEATMPGLAVLPAAPSREDRLLRGFFFGRFSASGVGATYASERQDKDHDP